VFGVSFYKMIEGVRLEFSMPKALGATGEGKGRESYRVIVFEGDSTCMVE